MSRSVFFVSAKFSGAVMTGGGVGGFSLDSMNYEQNLSSVHYFLNCSV